MILTIFLFIICIVAIRQGNTIGLGNKRTLTNMLKFITALLVVNGHLFAFGDGAENWAKEINIGPYCVSLLLFFSGYGLMNSYEKKRDAYLKSFIPHHLGRVILPLVTAYIVTLPIYKTVYGSLDWHHVLSTLYWGGPYLKFSWYVTEIIILYLLFYVIMRSHQKDAVKINWLTLAVLLLMGVLFITQQPVWYIESLPAFIVGIWFQRIEPQIKITAPAKIGIILLLSVTLLTTFYWSYVAENIELLSAFRYQYASHYIANIAFIVLMILAMRGLPPSLYNNELLS